MLRNMSPKDVPSSILQPAADDYINSLGKAIGELNETFPTMDSMNGANKSAIVPDFSRIIGYRKHVFSSYKNAMISIVYTICHCAEIAP